MITRRHILALAGGATLLALSRPASAATELAFADLYESDAVLSNKTLASSGTDVTMVGYMAPPLKAEASFFVLTSMPMAVCPFCETEAQWPDNIVLVLTGQPVEAVSFNRPIRVRGTLETGFVKDEGTGFVSLIRLVDARYEMV